VWQRLILPAVALGYDGAAFAARLARSSRLEVLRQDYMTTAHAKGLRTAAVILRHGFRNALRPVVTLCGLQFGRLLGGTVVVEAAFARPGVERLLVTSLRLRNSAFPGRELAGSGADTLHSDDFREEDQSPTARSRTLVQLGGASP
jgi:ABC-type dipeptide/oligopeptide/nickel transport system permease component